MWYATSYITNLFVVNLDNTCRDFFMLYILIKVPSGEAYQSTMFSNTSIIAWDMQGGSCSNINLYTGATRWLDSRLITPLKMHSENSLKYVLTTVSVNDHAQSKPENSYQAQTASRM